MKRKEDEGFLPRLPPKIGTPPVLTQLEGLETSIDALSSSLMKYQAPASFLDAIKSATDQMRVVPQFKMADWAIPFSQITTSSTITSLHAATKAYSSDLSKHFMAPLVGSFQIQKQLFDLNKEYTSLVMPSVQAMRLATDLSHFAIPASSIKAFEGFAAQTSGFTAFAAEAMKSWAVNVPKFTLGSEWLRAAPGVEQYSATRALAVAMNAPTRVLDESVDDDAEALLSRIGDELEARLASVHYGFVEPYRGAAASFKAQGPDWRRHVATSIRELVDHLLQELAPEFEMAKMVPKTAASFQNGSYTRKEQLKYIFREIAVDDYTIMAEKDIDLTLATFYPANAAVHSLVAPLTPEQMEVFWRRAQGCISTVLAAAGK